MTPAEQEQLIKELERDVDRLHALYNQYFMGIEKMEPSVPRKNLDRKIHLLRREQIKNTALRFRLQMQIQKYNTQCTYWNRICREIENGTYRRQVMLAKRRVQERHQPPPERASHIPDTLFNDMEIDGDGTALGAIEVNLDELGLDLDEPFRSNAQFHKKSKGPMNDLDDPFATMKTSPSREKPPRQPIHQTPPRPPQKSPQASAGKRSAPKSPVKQNTGPDGNTEWLKTIYRRYLAARKKTNESIEGLSFNTVARSLNAKIQSSNGNIDFKVVIRGGKAVIKTIKK